jgi:phosphoribosylformimino-5-aminoimidazole carboxamide ribotide isomerase
MRIIPAIDIIDGKCVRLVKGDYDKKTIYHDDPLEMAKTFEDHGVEHLHLVDLDGAKAGKIVNYDVLEKIANHTGLKIDFGGGIRSEKDVSIVLESGGRQAVIGSLAFIDKELFFRIMAVHGPEAIVLGADARKGKIAVGGWLETTDMDLEAVIREYSEKGVQYVLCTDIDKDGLMQGPATDLYRSILEQMPHINLIASGGIRNMDDVEEMEKIGCEGTIIGKAIYENVISLKEIENYIV